MLNGFAIFKVCYFNNDERDVIRSVKAARFNSEDGKAIDIIGNIVSWSKNQIIDMITDKSEGIRVFTASEKNDEYILGLEVEALETDGKVYLRTMGSQKVGDDLDNLPTYQAHC